MAASRYVRGDAPVVDDFAPPPLSESERRNVRAICNDRFRTWSAVLPSRPSIDRWDEPVGDPTVAGSIPDRPAHDALPFGDARAEGMISNEHRV